MTTKITGDNIGIGTTSPEGKLHVVNDQGGGTGRIIFDANVSSGYNTKIDATDTGLEFTAQSNSRGFAFNTGSTPTEKVRIQAGGGISFNGDTAAANALDDYEEGSWTPTFVGGTTAGVYTFSHEAWYVKIGRLVTVYAMLLNITDTTLGSGHINIGGLPFTSNADKDSVGSVRIDKFDLDSATRDVSATVYANSSIIKLLETRDNVTDITMTVDDRSQDGSDIFVQITYLTA